MVMGLSRAISPVANEPAYVTTYAMDLGTFLLVRNQPSDRPVSKYIHTCMDAACRRCNIMLIYYKWKRSSCVVNLNDEQTVFFFFFIVVPNLTMTSFKLFQEMERFTKTQPLSKRHLGFGTKDAFKRGEFTASIRTEQYR